MFNKEQLQRFSIRKLTVGTASVLIGVLFLTSWNANKVYADSGNVTNGESIAKNNNPQEGTPAVNDNAQIVDNGSTNGSTGISESPDSNRSNVIKSDNSRTTEPTGQANNKKVVSDANLTANDAQTKPTQQTAKSYAANSVVQRTKKLTGNAKLLADSKAQTDTKTDSNYSVTDNYPKDLMTYLPSDFDNKQEYAFEWLRNKNNNNIILTTNRTGDGEVYVYQDRTKVGTLAQNSSQPLYVTRRDIWEYDYQINIGTVYNDESAGIVQSNGYPLNIIYSSHAKDVDDAWYSTVSFFVPHKIPQTVTYKDSNGNVIDSLTHTQDGLTGQSYTTGLPSGSKYCSEG
ncbi:YSIRK-type signal peptide-containing protein, partial [Lactobacillus crispatus]|uniref:YSIRK-type signal peptide-containing protein n=1 Tax=Lactobacillus crispatus TaxID=47770 RepID=UPI0025509603|nr:YSIRK-type signal peptide-containing protein [Lactobacillus crispatus]MDK6666284.1 YSIRK-type signal peptide-containing protein [Lactobacillus crispatus]